MSSICLIVLTCLMALTSGRVVDSSRNSEVQSDESQTDVIYAPGTFEECPWVRTDEEYRMTCLEYIDESCGCVIGDQILSPEMCIIDDRAGYERDVHRQIELEMEKDQWRVSNGRQSSGQDYYRYLDCLDNISNIVAAVDAET